MKKQLLKLRIVSLSLLGIVGIEMQAQAQAFNFRSDIDSPAGNNSTMTLVINKFQQNCIGAIGTMNNLPVHLSVNNVPSPAEMITGQNLFYGLSNLPICSNQTPACGGSGPISYLETNIAFVYTLTSKVNVSASGLTNVKALLYPGFGYGNYQAANISGTYSVQPETFHAVNQSMINDLPHFVSDESIIFVRVNQPVKYSSAATDPDGDSLVYRLRPASPNATYATGFSYQNPITASPALALNSRTGEVTFTPTHYDQAARIGGIANTYIIGIDVDEYRKINGQATKIGTIQRNMLVNVIDVANQTPVLAASRNGTALPPNTIIDVLPGTPVSLNFSASDPDASDTVVLVTNAQSVLLGSQFTVTMAQNPNGALLTWTPSSSHVRQEPYFFNVSAKDNACPYPVSSTYTFGIRVRNITGVSSEFQNASSFIAFPNPAEGEVNFKIGSRKLGQKILICNLLGQEIDRLAFSGLTESEQIIRWENSNKFAAGTYVARLISGDKPIQTIKFNKL